MALASIPLRSPLKTPRDWRTSPVEPPSMKTRPANSRLSGRLARWCVTISAPARTFERCISRLTGMYFVAPVVVPDETANQGMRPGHVQSVRRGKGARQYASQNAS